MGVSKAKIFKGKYEAKLEFPQGWGFKLKKIIRGGGMDIFWKHTLVFCDYGSIMLQIMLEQPGSAGDCHCSDISCNSSISDSLLSAFSGSNV